MAEVNLRKFPLIARGQFLICPRCLNFPDRVLMASQKTLDKVSASVFAACFLGAIAYCVFLQLLTAPLLEPDGYYHLAVAGFIKKYGPLKNFTWTQMSVMRDFYSDKDFLFHVLIIPFISWTKDAVAGGKIAIIFFDTAFLAAMAYVLRKYLPGFLAGI
ncbi:MAG: hypothetical protein NTW04_00345, partial [Elusimicrobia bacterium]|nr:hypothetical protein [Elusimicrobiota bacterium]